mgnify:CR=1 FL=1
MYVFILEKMRMCLVFLNSAELMAQGKPKLRKLASLVSWHLCILNKLQLSVKMLDLDLLIHLEKFQWPLLDFDELVFY